ncbi:MAG: LTA synthase family protein [Muribaculaceae bacterium]|mgnify:FL=1|jgi:phosphoglycerol transferase MdoB-like AlkP superfamily enzyme
MKKALLKFLWIYLLFVVVFMLMKPVFLTVYASVVGATAAQWLAVVRHGLSMDLCVAGYLTVIPGLMLVGELLSRGGWLRRAMDIYMAVAAALVAVIYCLDLGLYGSWGFRLDMTPVFYFTTSPTAAMASVEWWHWLAGITGMGAICWGMWLLYRYTAGQVEVAPARGRRRVWEPVVMLLVTGLLFIPIRGSVTVSTMNLSRAYFSTNQRLNHAAVNPVFSLLYSATHQGGFDKEYDFMDDETAAGIVGRLLYASPDSVAKALPGVPGGETADSLATGLLSTSRPDIVMVILESFSAHLIPSLGGENVAPGLDSLAREGMLFTNFYASSFRTDRGLAAILSSFPAPPSTSLLKYVDKFERLPSFPSILRDQGYDAAYYYGGDANFTNMQAYLVSSGFSTIVSDKDFPVADRTSKWGAHDEKVFAKAFEGIKDAATGRSRGVPRLSVVQTSSSHEPFAVPYANPRFVSEPRKNAFAYTDSCLTVFVDSLRTLPNWQKTLLVVLPDHYGCWPENIDSPLERHHIPLVLAGGALTVGGERVDKLASQTDLAATLLAMMGIPSTGLRYSRDIFDGETAPVAVFTEPSLIGVVTPGDTLVYNPDADAVVWRGGETPEAQGEAPLLTAAKAFLRDLYATLARL